MTDDIPLAEMQLIWSYHGSDPEAPPAKVMRLGDRDNRDYFASWGACNADFNEATDEERLAMLFVLFHQVVLTGEVEPKALHEALLPVREYRDALVEELLTPDYTAERWQRERG